MKKGGRRPRKEMAEVRLRARAALVSDPGMYDDEVARVAGCSPTTAALLRAEAEGDGIIPVIPKRDRLARAMRESWQRRRQAADR